MYGLTWKLDLGYVKLERSERTLKIKMKKYVNLIFKSNFGDCKEMKNEIYENHIWF